VGVSGSQTPLTGSCRKHRRFAQFPVDFSTTGIKPGSALPQMHPINAVYPHLRLFFKLFKSFLRIDARRYFLQEEWLSHGTIYPRK